MSISKILRPLVALCVLVFATVLPVTAASAHDRLVDSTPAANEILGASPSELTLRFSAAVTEIAGGNVVTISAKQQGEVSTGELKIDGDTLTLPISAELNGLYSVAWRVVSSDGHPIEGSYVFGVGDVTAKELADYAAELKNQPVGQAATAAEEEPPGAAAVVWASIAVLVFAAIVIAVIVWYQRNNSARK
ncbi:copper resistance CopC family protein [Canibacter zhoujuaniae]|uniref:copper resistance CopC family protein n=1 Tax=Canibacter zhoujuaniae TaxID=2708343 RepID=UPI001422B486|nr:copper resistance CopC family protein [Canibacter zhoujuaniae]